MEERDRESENFSRIKEIKRRKYELLG